MEEALRAAAAAAAVQMQEEMDEGVPVASEAEAQEKTSEEEPATIEAEAQAETDDELPTTTEAEAQTEKDEDEPTTTEAEAQAETDKIELSLDGETEASVEEDVEWEIVGKPRSAQPIFGKFKEWDGGEHAPEASEEDEEEVAGASQADGMIEQEGVTGSATSSTNSVALDHEDDGQSSTSTGIDEGEDEEVGEEVEDAPVIASTDQVTAEAECVITLLQQDPAIITASLSPTISSSEPVVVSSPNTEDPLSHASVEEAVPDKLPNTSTDKIWPALPPIKTQDDFIARKPEVRSAEQVAASSRGILSYAAAAAVPANISTPIKLAYLQGVNKAIASKPLNSSSNGSPAASSPPTDTESIVQLPLRASVQEPLQEVLIKKADEVSEVPDEHVKYPQATPKKTFVRYAAQRREAEQVAQLAAAVAAAVEATQASPRDNADTEPIVTETPQTVSTPKKKRRSGAAQRKARKAKKLAAAGVELSSSRDADVELTDDSATSAEGLQSPESVASEADGETVVSPVIEDTQPEDTGNTTQEVLTDSMPEESSTSQPSESANHPEPVPVEEKDHALKPTKKARKNRTNAQRRAAKERAKQAASEPFVRVRVDIDVMCLAWVVAAIFACCIVAGVAGWFI